MHLNLFSGQPTGQTSPAFGQHKAVKTQQPAFAEPQDSVQIRFGQKENKDERSVEKRLKDAIADNDLLEVQNALYDGAEINTTDKSGAPAITQAIRHNDLIPGASIDLISFLLQDKIVIDGPDGDVAIDKADPDKADKAGFTPLMHAILADFADPQDRETVINLLLAAGADPTIPVPSVMGDSGFSIAELARDNGLHALAERLEVEMLGYGARADLGEMAESFGAGGKKLLVSDPILFPNMDFNDTSSDTRDEQGRTLLMRLVINDYFSDAVFDFLVGEQIILAAGDPDLSAEEHAIKGMESRAFLNEQDNEGYTALMYAAEKGELAIVEKLLKVQADPTLENHDRKTAADLAEANGHFKVATLLREKELGASIDDAFN